MTYIEKKKKNQILHSTNINETVKAYQHILDALSDMAYIKDKDFNYVAVNKAFLDFFKLSKEQVLGKDDFELLPLNIALKAHEKDSTILKSQETLEYEEELSLHNGSKSYVQTRKSLLIKEDQFSGIFGVSKDITSEKKFEITRKINYKILQDITKGESSQSIFKSIISHIDDINPNISSAIYLFDEEETFLHLKASSSRLKELKDIDVIAYKDNPILEQLTQLERVVIEDVNKKFKDNRNFMFYLKQGIQSILVEPIWGAGKKLVGSIIILYHNKDSSNCFELEILKRFSKMAALIAQKEKNETIIQQQDAMIIQQNKMTAMTEILNNIAHQWRQPLSFISTAASGIILQKNYDILDEAFLEQTLDEIINTTQNLSSTIDQFADYFKQNSIKTYAQVNDVIDEVLRLYKTEVAIHNIEIHRTIYQISCKIDIKSLKQVLINLLNNAFEAFESSKVEHKVIKIRLEQQQNQVIISIANNAKSIDANHLNKVFEPYFTTKHQSQGTGLGLYMSLQVMHRDFNGDIKVKNAPIKYQSQINPGVEFKIIFPKKNL